MTTIVIMPGGFHPFHAGHFALYQSAQKAFPRAEVFVAATNDTSTRPFPFPVKEKLAKLAGVEPGHFVQVKSPFRAEEITSRFNPAKDVLIFVRSEKDANKPPQAGGIKKDGSLSYLQPLQGQTRYEPFAKHAYMVYLPTVEFGPGMTSATEIRTAWPTLNEKRKTALVMSLYPKTQSNPKLAANVVKLLDAAIGSEGIAEAVEEEPGPQHRIAVKVTDPVTYNDVQKIVRVDATDKQDALDQVEAFYAKKGIYIVNIKYLGMVGQQGVTEGLDEAVGGNYLYHATSAGGLKGMLSSGSIRSATGPQAATSAQTTLPTVSVTRDWGYASGAQAQSQLGGIGRDAILVLDRNAVESNFKTLGTSQSTNIKGLAFNPYLKKDGAARSQNTDPMARTNAKAKAKYAEPTAKAGSEFEEAVVVPKGALPLKGTMVGFWVNPKSELIKDTSIMNDSRRLDMARPNQFVKATQQQGVEEGSLNEFAPGAGDDGGGEDPYKYPKPKRYARSADYFGQFEADHFDREKFDDATGVFKGYWGQIPIAYFKFANPAQTGGDDPGMGWYYEPESSSRGNDGSTRPDVDRSTERKQQELGMIDQFLKSGNRPNPDSQIGRLMKKHGLAEGATVTRIDSKPIADFASNLKGYKHTDNWSQSGLDTGDDSYWNKHKLKVNSTKGLFAGDPRRTALYATGNAHETRYVEYTENGQPVVYFDKKDIPAMRSRKTYLTVFDADKFKKLPTGEWFSENPGTPIEQTPIGDPFKYIASQGWIVRVTDDLDKVFNQVKKMHKAGKIAQYGAEGMNESQQGVAEAAKKCPPATQDITLNLANRQKAIDEYGYGPLNPDLPNNKFWMKKVDEWNLDSAEEAKQSLCGNCAAFDVRQNTLDCIAQGIDSDSPEDAAGVIDAGDLGYCKFLKFKCASRRTCDAWVTGGPLQDKPIDENQGWAATLEDQDYIEEK